MSSRDNLTGQRFGRWTALSYAGHCKWNCRCDCGTEKAVDRGSLKAGRSTGCEHCRDHGNRRTHGEKRSRLYNIWSGIIARCENPNEPGYDRYGGRGIGVCSEWRNNFTTFRDWALINGYAANLTIDRINNAEGYEPSNCRWATHAEQNRNYSRNRPIEYQGRKVLLCDLAIQVGLPQDILKNRIFRYGWSVEEAVATPVMKRGQRRALTFTVEKRKIDG